MAEPTLSFTLSLSQLHEIGRAAGREAAEAALSSFADQHGQVKSLIDRSGAFKAVLSTAEASRYAGVTPGTIRKWIRDGMPATLVGGRAGHQIRKTDIDEWRTRQRVSRADV